MIDYPSPNFSVSIVSTFEDVFPNLNFQHSFSLRTISWHSSTLPHIEIGLLEAMVLMFDLSQVLSEPS